MSAGRLIFKTHFLFSDRISLFGIDPHILGAFSFFVQDLVNANVTTAVRLAVQLPVQLPVRLAAQLAVQLAVQMAVQPHLPAGARS
jgi:hypothetical protein